jgi:hypothetical protein
MYIWIVSPKQNPPNYYYTIKHYHYEKEDFNHADAGSAMRHISRGLRPAKAFGPATTAGRSGTLKPFVKVSPIGRLLLF